ncbi:DUF4124 domain-containing protein [Thalassotalea montiporae]
MYKLIPTLCLLLFTMSGNAQDTTVYRWVDKDNIVHFSHQHPNDKDFAKVDVRVAYAPVVPDGEKNSFVDDWLAERQAQKEAKNELERARQASELIEKNCQAAQVNLKLLGGFERILLKEPDGSSRLLTPEEKQEQRMLNKQHVEIYCDDNDNS